MIIPIWIKTVWEKFSLSFHWSKVNSPSIKVDNKAEIAEMHIHSGLSYADVKDLVTCVVDQKLAGFEANAQATYIQRREEFKTLLMERLKNLPIEETSKLKDPDTQLALIEAAKISGRKQDEELRNLLANLVVNRIKNDKTGKEDLKNIVYNEAISTVNKLTVDQLKIITLCYVLRYTHLPNVLSWSAFNNFLNKMVKPFMGFKNTNAEFQHIEYSGCGSIGLGSWDAINGFRNQYSVLFSKPIKKEQIDSLSFTSEVKTALVMALCNEQDLPQIKFQNWKHLETYLKSQKTEAELLNKFQQLYYLHIKNEVSPDISQKTDIGKELVEVLKTSPLLNHLSLTSVGIALAISYFEQVTGDKIDINIWIN